MVHTGTLRWDPQVNIKCYSDDFNTNIRTGLLFDIKDLNPVIYMLINFSLESQRNAPLTFSKKHFIKPQCDHSANLFNVILMKCRFVISRRDKVCKREGGRERESKMRRKKVHSQCGSEYQQ